MNEIKVSFELSKQTMVLIALAFGVGYLLGNVSGVSTFTGNTVGTDTIIQQQPTQQPAKVKVSTDDDPQTGDKNARVTVIEFSDFQCPFYRRSYTDTILQLKNDYIDTGKVLFVYRDFPLSSLHPSALPAALAANCANEQDKFWEYHNKIFDEQNKLGQGTIQFSNDDLKKWANEIELDTKTFDSCLDSKKYENEVEKDFQDGVDAGVSGTPTFFIGNQKEGYTRIIGAQPYPVIKQVIDSLL